jgi:hypothetical protein
LTPNGFGEKTRVLDSPRTRGKEVTAVRELWARICNHALARNGLDKHVDSRSLKAQGIDREPTRHLGPTASAMERRGIKTFRGDENRRRRNRGVEKELAALQKIENGIEAALMRHERRKYRAELDAERLKREKETQRLAEAQRRDANQKGMQR